MDFGMDAFLELQYSKVTPKWPVSSALSGEMGFDEWRASLSHAFSDRLGGQNPELPPIDLQLVSEEQIEGMTRFRLYYVAEDGLPTPAYYLLPDQPAGNGEALPAVVAIAGHGYGNRDVVGIRKDGTNRAPGEDPGYHKDFALALCRKGFVVIAPEMFGFGDLRLKEDFDKDPGASSCFRMSTYLHEVGRTAAGVRVNQCKRALDVLSALGHTDMNRVGCMGISGGGMVSSYFAALEPRIRACVVSGYANTFHDSIMGMFHCSCNFVPGLLEECEMPDMLSLIAPRPMLWESGTKDCIFPIEAVQRARAQVMRVYEKLGVPERFEVDVFEGEHQISGAMSYDFLKKWL